MWELTIVLLTQQIGKMEELNKNTIYNFWCYHGCTPKNINATGEHSKCPKCNKEMKVLGTVAHITYIDTQELKI